MIVIESYTPIYKDAVIELICNEYGYDKQNYANYFEAFYDKKYQAKSILIIALDNNKVVGFQSFFFWPYIYNGKQFNSFQSGNSIVDNSYRGKGIFKKMLQFIENGSFNIDFIVGFPVESSYHSFMKVNWKNPFNLQWYLKFNNLFSVFFKPNYNLLENKFGTHQKTNLNKVSTITVLSNHEDFLTWRNSYYKNSHYYYTYCKDNNVCEIGFKLNIRKKYLKELIIGQINGNLENTIFVTEAIKSFLKEVRKIKSITFVSIAINSNNIDYTDILKKINFKKTEKKIYFIIKEMKIEFEQNEYHNWLILRGDLDTW
jgi:hypothetical protein